MRVSSKNPALSRESRARAAAAAAAVLALVTACNPYVQGNGVFAEEARPDLAPFAGIRLESGDIQGGDRLTAVVTSGEAQSVKVVGDANIVREIVTQVEPELVGSTTVPILHVSVDVSDKYDPVIPPQVVISVPSFSFVRAEGASAVQVKKAGAAAFTVNASGTSSVTLTGVAGFAGDLIDATLANETLLDATNYTTARGRVSLSGTSVARLHANGPVTGTATDLSTVDNLLGTGRCDGVVVSGSAEVRCN